MQTIRGKFHLGRLLSTPGVHAAVAAAEIDVALARHLMGDWGDVSPDDWEENELSLAEGFRLISTYRTGDGTKFWIITEADRSATTVLLPEEY